MPTVPGSSVRAVRRVARLDGRTRVVAVRTPGGDWRWLDRKSRFTRETVRELQAEGIASVVLRRPFRGGVSIPLSWVGSVQRRGGVPPQRPRG